MAQTEKTQTCTPDTFGWHVVGSFAHHASRTNVKPPGRHVHTEAQTAQLQWDGGVDLHHPLQAEHEQCNIHIRPELTPIFAWVWPPFSGKQNALTEVDCKNNHATKGQRSI